MSKTVKTICEILLNISGVFAGICFFAGWDIVFWILFFLQMFIPVYNYYRVKSFERLKLFSILFILSNISIPVVYKMYYEFYLKRLLTSSGFGYGAVFSEIAVVSTMWIFIIAAAMFVIGDIASVITWRVKHKEE